MKPRAKPRFRLNRETLYILFCCQLQDITILLINNQINYIKTSEDTQISSYILCVSQDILSWVQGKAEVEVVDLLLQMREKLVGTGMFYR